MDAEVRADPEAEIDLAALDAALCRLAEVDPQKAKLVELRYFAGLTGDQAAAVLGISSSSADRQWVYAPGLAAPRAGFARSLDAQFPEFVKVPDASRAISRIEEWGQRGPACEVAHERGRGLPAGAGPEPPRRACGVSRASVRRRSSTAGIDRSPAAGERGGERFPVRPAPGLARHIDQPIREGPGTVIGSYKLLEQIGEGGMGVVYMAEQMQPVRRKVALKVIKPGMDTRQVIARFEAERQALALMDHPNIARILDAGATESGRPYFVMELVRGIPITEYCDRNRLTIAERLDLFVLVCQAVQHAHQKGIIHRDLKPSNVLITLHDGVPVPKVIDFGIAKATGQQSLTDKTLYTGFAELIGTPCI